MRDAVVAALKDAGLKATDIQGMAVASFSARAGYSAVDLAWKTRPVAALRLAQDTNGGSAGMSMLGNALRTVEAGTADVVLILGGDATRGLPATPRSRRTINTATQKHLSPSATGGPNGVLCPGGKPADQKYGLGEIRLRPESPLRSGNGRRKNPYAVYRAPLTMDEYLAAPLVADPLSRLRLACRLVAGAQAIIVARPDRAPKGRPGVRVRAHRASYNYDNQEGDGLQTGISTFAKELWQEAGVRSGRYERRQHLRRTIRPLVWRRPTTLASFPVTIWRCFCRVTIGEKRFPWNTGAACSPPASRAAMPAV